VDEVEVGFPAMTGRISRDWTSILDSNCSLEMWVRKMIEGKCNNNELHGIKINKQEVQEVEMGEVEQMILFLTYGPTCIRYNYRKTNHVPETLVEAGSSRTRYGRVSKSSLTKFTKFDGANVIMGDQQ